MTRQPGTRLVSCPVCGTPVAWNEQQKWRPFCSHRCRMIDLGDWLDENHRIPCEDAGTESTVVASREYEDD